MNFRDDFDEDRLYSECFYSDVENIVESFEPEIEVSEIGVDAIKEQVFITDYSNGHMIYRNPKERARALKKADYHCEYCNHLESIGTIHDKEMHLFKNRNGDRFYTEGHHLIPIGAYRDYDEMISTDNCANIISLCTYCHSKIHQGQDYEKEIMIRTMIELRFDRLFKVGLVYPNESRNVLIKRVLEKYYNVK